MNLRPVCLVFSNLVLLSALFLSGCATSPNNAQSEVVEAEDFNDPLEDANRAIFDFNQKVDRNVLVPVAKAYRTVLPEPVRDSLRDFLRNLRAPLIFVNNALQGDLRRDAMTEKRCHTRPGEAPLAVAAKFPQLSRLTGRRQPNARPIE